MKTKFIMIPFWRARSERFWHMEYLEYLTGELRFSGAAAYLMSTMGINERREMALNAR